MTDEEIAEQYKQCVSKGAMRLLARVGQSLLTLGHMEALVILVDDDGQAMALASEGIDYEALTENLRLLAEIFEEPDTIH